MDPNLVEELQHQLDEFDQILRAALATPTKLEQDLSKIESRVAVLTRGWRGSEERDMARGAYKVICIRLRYLFFVLKELKTQMQTSPVDDRVQTAFMELFKDDKPTQKKIETASKAWDSGEYDDIVTTFWDAIKQQVVLIMHSAVKTGIENRIRKEADEEAAREMAKVKNPTYGLAQILASGDLNVEQGRLKTKD